MPPKPPRPAERYRLKYRRLRRAARALVFENGALCDEVSRLEAKWLRARHERRFLLTRLLQLRAAAGTGATANNANAAAATAASGPEEAPPGPCGRRARRGAGRDGGKDAGRAARPRDAGRASEARARPKEAARPAGPGEAAGHREEAGDGHVEETRPGDGRGEADLTTAGEDAGPPAAILRTPPRGRRGLPLSLGPLTVHSLGVGGLGPGAVLPLGYRSTRLFASARRPSRRCLYTCRVVAGPRCEIVAEDEPGRVLAGPTPDVCHARLLQALGEAGGRNRAMPPAPGAGDDFFGLSHPAVRRLLLRGEAGAFVRPEEEEDEDEDEEEEEEDEEEDEEDEEEDEEEEAAAPAFAYADVFLGSPAGSDE